MSSLKIIYNSSYIKGNELVFIILLITILVILLITAFLVKQEIKKSNNDK